MSVEEKRSKVDYYCGRTQCSECVLKCGGWDHPTADNCVRIGRATESELDRAIALIEGKVVDPVIDPVVDPVNRPSHYTDGKIEVIDYIEDKKLGFCLGNAIKYISRAGKKDPSKEVEDLNKAVWYINRRIKEIQEGIV